MDKYSVLKEYLASLGSVAIAFSGGVDSTFLLRTAHDVLGEKAIALTLSSPFMPKRELQEAESLCRTIGAQQILVPVDVLAIDGVVDNPPNRCYYCKRGMFSALLATALAQGITHVAEGSNMDDLGDYRPGLQAVKELEILSPLRHAGLTKAEIRALSRELGLPTWEKPSYACLASRFVYGERITPEKLLMVERAEELLMSLGFRQMRVRLHGNMARIELMPEDFGKMLELREKVYDELKGYGFSYVALDLRGYKTGSMNDPLRTQSTDLEL